MYYLDCIATIAYLYLFIWASVRTLPISILVASFSYHLWPCVNKQQKHQLNPVLIYTSLTPIIVARILWIASGIKSCALKMFGVSVSHFARYHPIYSALFTKDTCLLPNSCMLENKMRLCGDIDTSPAARPASQGWQTFVG